MPRERHIYRFTFTETYAERRATCGGMDSELTGRHLTRGRTWTVVAPSEEMAVTAWRVEWGSDGTRTFGTVEKIGRVDCVITVS